MSFVDYMILYKENPKKPVKKLLGLISFSRVAGCKRNIKNLVAFLYTTDEASEKEIKDYSIHNSIKNNRIHRNKFNKKSIMVKTMRL